jgi:hypothetical protein
MPSFHVLLVAIALPFIRFGVFFSDVRLRRYQTYGHFPMLESYTLDSKVILAALPPGLLKGLPREDQKAIRAIVGKPVLLEAYDEDGRAELTFTDSDEVLHSVFVSPKYVKRTEAPTLPPIDKHRGRFSNWMFVCAYSCAPVD